MGHGKGIAEGMAKGMEKGLVEGEHKKAIEIAKNLLEMGLDVDTIVKASGLSKEEVAALASNNIAKQ